MWIFLLAMFDYQTVHTVDVPYLPQYTGWYFGKKTQKKSGESSASHSMP
jgi:hypothetical protein